MYTVDVHAKSDGHGTRRQQINLQTLLFTHLLSTNPTSPILFNYSFLHSIFFPRWFLTYTLHAREQTKKEGQLCNTTHFYSASHHSAQYTTV